MADSSGGLLINVNHAPAEDLILTSGQTVVIEVNFCCKPLIVNEKT